MFEITEGAATAATPKPERPSLARSAELQAALVNLLQLIRQAPAILHALDLDELRQLDDAAIELRGRIELAADILIAQRVAAAGRT